MKTVLYAVDRMIPDQDALSYTLNLCRRMLARLDVLHIVPSPDGSGSRLKSLRSGMLMARDAFEKTMVTATFAEAGVPDPETALKTAAFRQFRQMLPEKPEPRINYQCVVSGDASDAIIERYVHRHHEVVLTVFDSQARFDFPDKQRTTNHARKRRTMPNLAIPLVLVRHAH